MGEDKEDIKTGVSSETGAQVTTLEKVTKIVLLNVIVRVNIVPIYLCKFLFHTIEAIGKINYETLTSTSS